MARDDASSRPGDPLPERWIRGNERIARMLDGPGMHEAMHQADVAEVAGGESDSPA